MQPASGKKLLRPNGAPDSLGVFTRVGVYATEKRFLSFSDPCIHPVMRESVRKKVIVWLDLFTSYLLYFLGRFVGAQVGAGRGRINQSYSTGHKDHLLVQHVTVLQTVAEMELRVRHPPGPTSSPSRVCLSG